MSAGLEGQVQIQVQVERFPGVAQALSFHSIIITYHSLHQCQYTCHALNQMQSANT